LAGTEDVVLVVLALAGQTNSAMILDLFLPTSEDRPSYGAMVERRDGPSWLCDDDDDDNLVS